MSTAKAECRKFSPNIFNRSKCQHCFASKDSHSAEALDSNRVSRKVSKCGYLFVAPDWDFSNPINRTKRWQRRWFILYDDGELTYSVDEHPETVPQSIIDMTKVLEVSNAEDVTGNQFSIAITAPEKVHFIKGTSREESQWWFHELAIFPRMIKNSRYKRNATFPGGTATTVSKGAQLSSHSEEVAHFHSDSHLSRTRYSSCNAASVLENEVNALPSINDQKSLEEFLDIEIIPNNNITSTPISKNQDKVNNKKNSEKTATIDSTSPIKANDKVRSRHLLKREQRSVPNSRSHSDSVSHMIPRSFEATNKPLMKRLSKNSNLQQHPMTSPLDIMLFDKIELKRQDNKEFEERQKSYSSRQQYHNDKNLEISRQLSETSNKAEDKKSSDYCISNFIKPSLDSNQNYYIPSTIELVEKPNGNSKRSLSTYMERKSANSDSSLHASPSGSSSTIINQKNAITDHVQVRGDPDGCGLDSCCNFSNGEEGGTNGAVSVKKGWLMIQKSNKDWARFWFVLETESLRFYRDSEAEERRAAEGYILLSQVKSVEEIDASRSYGFCIKLKDNHKYVLSALTCGIRASWIQAVMDTASLKAWDHDSSVTSLGEKIEKEISVLKEITDATMPFEEKSLGHPDSLLSPRSCTSSDDEFKTASETSVRTEDYSEWVDEDVEHSSTSRALPPSPPLNRTPISKVKERARTRSNIRVGCEKNDKLKPDSKLISLTKDDVPKEELSGSDQESTTSCRSSSDLRKHVKQKKALASDVPDSMLVKSLESEVELLRRQLEHAQECLNSQDDSNFKSNQMSNTTFDIVNSDQSSLSVNDAGICSDSELFRKERLDQNVICSLKKKVAMLENQITELVKEIELKNAELLRKDEELVKMEKSLKNLSNTKHGNLNESSNTSIAMESEDSSVLQQLQREEEERLTKNLEKRLATSESKIFQLVSEMEHLCQSREAESKKLKHLLSKKQKENEKLKNDVQDLNAQLTSAGELNSLSEENKEPLLKSELGNAENILAVPNKLTGEHADAQSLSPALPTQDSSALSEKEKNLKDDEDLHKKYLRAFNEIQALRRELKEAHQSSDDLELLCITMKQDARNTESDFNSQIALMTVRIEDLTSKLSNAEKNNRQLKQKLTRQDSKEQRRTRSLKGREAFTVSKELEMKLGDLENKVKFMEQNLDATPTGERSSELSLSVDGQQTQSCPALLTEASNTSISDSLELLVRIKNLESKINNVTGKMDHLKSASSSAIETNENPESNTCIVRPNHRFGPEDNLIHTRDSFAQKLSNLCMDLDECGRIAQQQLALCTCKFSETWKTFFYQLQRIKTEIHTGISLSQSSKGQTNQQVITKLKNLLQKRKNFLGEKHKSFKQFSSGSAKADAGPWLEKIFGDTLLLGKITCLLQQLNVDASFLQLRDARSCYQKMILLEKRLSRHLKGKIEDDVCSQEKGADDDSKTEANKKLPRDLHQSFMELSNYEKQLQNLMSSYKACNLKSLAELMTYKTLSCQLLTENEETLSMGKNLQEKGKMKMFNTLSQKLMEAELQRVITTLLKLYENELSIDLEINGNFFLESDDEQQKRYTIIHRQLVEDMDRVHQELKDSYLQTLNNSEKLPESGNTNLVNRLSTFVTTVAENAIAMGYFQCVQQNLSDKALTANKDNKLSSEFINLMCDVFDQEMEVLYVDYDTCWTMLKGFDDEIGNSVPDLAQMSTSRQPPLNRYTSVQDILQKSESGKPTYFMNSYEARLQRSFRQRGQRSVTMPISYTAPTTEASAPETEVCQNCQMLQDKIKGLKQKHVDGVKEIMDNHAHDLISLETKFKEEIKDLRKRYDDDIAILQERIVTAERKQLVQKAEYHEEISALNESYEQEVVRKTDTVINEESIRQRYQAEIEQLRGLCEKGLVAMENSHRRIIGELEEKHRYELEHLQVEKEQALAEETQATLAALDAMRKAHEVELQKEIAKFKQEFLQKMQSTNKMDAMHKERRGEEMETIKEEILSLSEKYSIKCLENAALEERLQPMTQQLAEANTQIFNLTARNKQLRSALETSNVKLKTEIDAANVTEPENDAKICQLQLQLKDKELLSQKEVVAELELRLQRTMKHEQELRSHRRLLEQSLKAERQLREDEVSSLRDRLEHIILTGNASGLDSTSKQKSTTGNTFRRSGELMRSPSCPGLSDAELYSSCSNYRSRMCSSGASKKPNLTQQKNQN